MKIPRHKKWPVFTIRKNPFFVGLFLGGLVLVIITTIFLLRPHPQPKVVKTDPTIAKYTPPGAAIPPGFTQTTKLLLPSTSSVRVPILLYHYVEFNPDPSDTIRTSLAVTPFWFEKQLQYLADHHYTTITFDDLTSAIKRSKPLPTNPVILTFDDGYRDFYTDAWPLLKKYRAKATIFIISGFLDRHNYLYTWQLKQIATDSSHLVTLGAHTVHHAYLPALKPQDAVSEIQASKDFLEKNFNQAITVFAYPYGAFNDQVAKITQAAGFQIAVSTLFGENHSSENIFYLPRIRVGNYAGETFAKRLNAKP